MTETEITLPEVFEALFATTTQPGDKKALWREHVTQNMTKMVEAYEEADAEKRLIIDTAFDAVTAYGFRGLSKETIKSIKAEVLRRHKLREAVKLRELEQKLRIHKTMWDALDGAHPPATYATRSQLQALTVPVDYKVTPDGVFKGSLNEESLEIEWASIAPSPIFPVSRTTDRVTGVVERMMMWRTAGGWRRYSLQRDIMLDTSKIVTLATLDAPVASTRAREVVEFLDAFEAANQSSLEETQVAHVCGWTERGDFVMPAEYWASPTSEDDRPLTFIADDGMETMAAGWKAGGTFEGWLEAVDLIRDKPIMWLGLYTALAGPLLKVLGCPGWITDVSGETSHGKTTWLQFAASAGGKPTMEAPSIIGSWDQTPVYIEHQCGFHNNLPVFLDETKRARYRKTVSDIAYQFWQGQGRGRGKRVGVRKTMTWQTTMCTTGEEAMTNFSNDAGTRARVLSIRGKPMGKSSAANGEKAEELVFIVSENYGHLMPRFIDAIVPIMNDDEKREAVREMWKRRRGEWAVHAENGVGRRLANYAACMHVVADIAHGRNGFEGIGLPEPAGDVDPFEVVAASIQRVGRDADVPGEALCEVMSWCAANVSKFYRGRGATEDVYEWYGIWEENRYGLAKYPFVVLQNTILRDLLHRFGYTPTDIIDTWIARGYYDPGSGRGRGKTYRAGDQSLYGGVFTQIAWARYKQDEEDEDIARNVSE